jgi:hypothetical protein
MSKARPIKINFLRDQGQLPVDLLKALVILSM